MLECRNLSQSFALLNVLDDVSFTIQNGEFVSLIGPSGSGKSTLLKILSGIDKETSGEILFSGKAIKNRRGKSGYMPQNLSLLPWRTVIENVMVGLDIRGGSNNISLRKGKQLLTEFGLADFVDSYPKALSYGMSQRVALLRTVVFNHRLLLFDEPFGALDALTRLSMQTWLLKLWQHYHSSVLLVTHDIREAILLSDRILLMSKRPGKIVKEIAIDLPRPRTRDVLFTKKAIGIERKLLGLLGSD